MFKVISFEDFIQGTMRDNKMSLRTALMHEFREFFSALWGSYPERFKRGDIPSKYIDAFLECHLCREKDLSHYKNEMLKSIA